VSRRHPNVVNVDEVDWWRWPKPAPRPFEGDAKRLSAVAGGKGLGANLFRVPPGGTAVPLHAHHANEEAVYVLQGRGTLRIGGKHVEVRPGDWIALPPGAEFAHQIFADKGEELLYLCVSTMNEVDVITYPDSKKLLAVAGAATGGIRSMFRLADGGVDYFEGEGEHGWEDRPAGEAPAKDAPPDAPKDPA
jgi:uncharacterized cupin superfamily protein